MCIRDRFHTIQYEKNEYFGGPQVPGGAGYSHFGAKPAMSGNIMVIPAPEFTRHPDINGSSLTGTDPDIKTSVIYGAIVTLSGSGVQVNKTTEQEVTESVENTVYVETNVGAIPMRLGMSVGAPNLRLQSTSSAFTIFKGTKTI